jgi:hypothetical protein
MSLIINKMIREGAPGVNLDRTHRVMLTAILASSFLKAMILLGEEPQRLSRITLKMKRGFGEEVDKSQRNSLGRIFFDFDFQT